MYTIADLMKRYGVSEKTVLDWVHSGDLRAINVGKKAGKKRARWRITDAALADFEAARSTGGAAGPLMAPDVASAPERARKRYSS